MSPPIRNKGVGPLRESAPVANDLGVEQLRRADYFAGGKTVSIGGSSSGGEPAPPHLALSSPAPTPTVGDINAEPYYTGPSTFLDDVYTFAVPPSPGPGLLTLTEPSNGVSDTVKWYGPEFISSGTAGTATAPLIFVDASGFGSAAVGDLLLIKPFTVGGANDNIIGVVLSAVGDTLTLSASTTPLTVDSNEYSWAIMHPNAVQLFAIPGSGPLGHEQSFLTVIPGSTLHNNPRPTASDIETDRVKNMVPASSYGADLTVDRSDAIFSSPAPFEDLTKLGYRIVLYPDNGTGTAPDLTRPIATASPLIDPGVTSATQRMTIDYRAGVVRFSTPPEVGGDIKISGGVNSTTGRLNLYATFWSVDTTNTHGTAQGVYAIRSDQFARRTRGRISFDLDNNAWTSGSTPSGNLFYTYAPDVDEDDLLPVEFGAYDQTTPSDLKRYFVYRKGTNEWRFRRQYPNFSTDPKYNTEVVVADKTAATFGDISAPGLSLGGDYNPTSAPSGQDYGARDTTSMLVNGLLESGNSGSYGVTHLRKGRFYTTGTTVHIPPGMILEGEGAATRVFAKQNSTVGGSDPDPKIRPVFKFGPNVGWGVYDATAEYDGSSDYGASVTPSIITPGSLTDRVEGMDVVWNPVRRVWATVFASITANAVYFNEYNLDGTSVYPGLGLDVKDSVLALFSTASTNSSNHTAAHYPRIAYQEFSDEYSVVWVEEITILGTVGPRVRLQSFRVTPDSDTGLPVPTYIYGSGGNLITPNVNMFTDHPSVAVDNYTTGPTDYLTAVSCWVYDTDGAGLLTASGIYRQYNRGGAVLAGAVTLCDTDILPVVGTNAKNIISSTDVAEDGQGGFQFVWSRRMHRLLRGTQGVKAGSFSDGSGIDFDVENVQPGSRFHKITRNSGDLTGADGLVYATAVTSLFIKVDAGAALGADAGPFTWAITPWSAIEGIRAYYNPVGPSVAEEALQTIVRASPPTTPEFTTPTDAYMLEMREPDFVRVSRGNLNWLVAFQSFESTGYLSKASFKNYDNGFDTGFVDQTGITALDTEIHRELISTCAVLLNDAGAPSYPTSSVLDYTTTNPRTGALADTASADLSARVARDVEVFSKSLGAREPITFRPNYIAAGRAGRGYAREVASLLHMHRWTTSAAPSVIPDVTWSGSDWTIVSPAKPNIQSFTGHYRVSGGTAYLSDIGFYFGDNSSNPVDGNYLRRTLPVAGAYIYFPAAVSYAQITAVHDEHTVELDSQILGALPLTQVQWSLVLPTVPDSAGIKNPGFRISEDGRLIQSSSYLTFADEPKETDGVTPHRVELMRRPNATTLDGFNDPSSITEDTFNPGSRHKADVSYKGVAVGMPKGCNASSLDEAPMAAIAWGETLYGFLDRVVAGYDPAFSDESNNILFFRQSFGPYNSGIRNLQLIGDSSVSSGIDGFSVLTYQHVYTRHGSPTNGSGNFATDGYRNCYVVPATRTADALSPGLSYSYVTAYYTDALGRNPLQMAGPALTNVGTQIPNEFSKTSYGPTTTQYPSNAVPKVIWDGSRFIAAWSEYHFSGSSVGHTISVAAFPGGEDRWLPGSEMVDPDESATNLTATTAQLLGAVQVTDGTSGAHESITVVDIAFSGKVYAILYVSGVDTASSKGAAVGVCLFETSAAANNGSSEVRGIANHVLDMSATPDSYAHPKITWDGKQFVGIWQNNDGGTQQIQYVIVPEMGMAHTKMIRRAAATAGVIDQTTDLALGVTFDATHIDMSTGASGKPLPLQPGDIICVNKVGTGGGVSADSSGWYTVLQYDPSFSPGAGFQGRATVAGAFQDIGKTVYGGILSGGVSDTANVQGSSLVSVDQAPRVDIDPRPSVLQNGSWATIYSSNGSDVFRVNGIVYNESEDEYAVLYQVGGGVPVISTFSREGNRNRPEVHFTTTGYLNVSLAWNGRHYLVIGYSSTGLDFMLLNASLHKESSGTITSLGGIVGNVLGAVPGPLYGDYETYGEVNGTVPARFANAAVNWNYRLNRWVVSASIAWYDQTPVVGRCVGDLFDAGLLTVWGVGSRTVTLGTATKLIQPGTKIAFVDSGTLAWHGVVTVMSIVGGGGGGPYDTFLVDATRGQCSSIVIGDLAMVLPREDVFTWTLGYESPTVLFEDADDCFVENVSISGPSDIEEKYPNMARPMWLSGGHTMGTPVETGAADPAIVHPPHFQHNLLVPTVKTALPKISNMKSMAKHRHGYGMLAGNPYTDRDNGRRGIR